MGAAVWQKIKNWWTRRQAKKEGQAGGDQKPPEDQNPPEESPGEGGEAP